MNNWKILAFYTPSYEGIYEQYLKKSCQNLGLEDKLIIYPIADQGSWTRNTAQKPKILLDYLTKNPDKEETIILLDVDATIEKYPTLFDDISEQYDIAFHTLNWATWYGHSVANHELLTGTMFFRNTEAVRKLCKQWYEEAMKGDRWEQKVLETIIPNSNVIVYPLPLSYCYIKTRPGNLEPLIKLDPVILHHQLSRVMKRRR